MKCGNNQTNCNTECIIVPLATIFKPKNRNLGGIWQCSKCGWHSLDKFPTNKEIEKYKEIRKRVDRL